MMRSGRRHAPKRPVKLDATGGDDLPAQRDGRDQGQRVAVVDMDHVRLERRNRPPQVPPGAGIQTDVPGRTEHADAAGGRALRKLGALLGDERLFDSPPGLPAQLAAQEPDLILAAAPGTARVYLQYPHRSRPGSLRYAGTFTTPASTRRSASSLKGFWRNGRPSSSRNCSVSPRTVSPVAKMMRSATVGCMRASV